MWAVCLLTGFALSTVTFLWLYIKYYINAWSQFHFLSVFFFQMILCTYSHTHIFTFIWTTNDQHTTKNGINSATCRDTYGLPDYPVVKKGESESRAFCTSEYSDISPLRDGNVAFSTLEGRPSAITFDQSIELQVYTNTHKFNLLFFS